jgi:hypothetical protein
MTRFYAETIHSPDQIIPLLGKGERHWRKGYSAYELAHRWLEAEDGVPGTVRTVLDQAEEWREATLLEGFFERRTDLRSAGRPSQTDLLGVLRLSGGVGVLGIEGKVEEPFGPRVSEWLADGSAGKRRRLETLCTALGISPERAEPLRYQLLHRTGAALFEGEGYGAPHAMMLVHSFSTIRSGYDDFARIAEAIELPVTGPGNLANSLRIGQISLRIGVTSRLVV